MRGALLLWLFLAVGAGAQPGDSNGKIRQLYQAGEQALRAGDLALARQSFTSVLQLAPEDVGARVNLAVTYMRESQWDSALRYLKQAEQRAPQVTGIRLNIGLVEYRRANYTAAVPAFQSVLRDQPDSVQARRLLGLCYLFTERYREAADTLEPLWDQSSSDLSYLYSLAVAAGNAKRHDLEERALARLMVLGKESPLVHLLQGKAYLAREDFDRALAEIQAAAEADRKLPLVHYNLGVVYRRQGRFDKAREEFQQDIALEPKVAFNYDQLGEIEYREQHLGAARTYFERAVGLDPKLGTSWFGLAKIAKQEKQYPEALKALERAGAIDPDSASVHYLRAQLLTELGRKPEAQTEMAAVRRLKAKTLDKLEAQVNGSVYHDPEVPVEGAP